MRTAVELLLWLGVLLLLNTTLMNPVTPPEVAVGGGIALLPVGGVGGVDGVGGSLTVHTFDCGVSALEGTLTGDARWTPGSDGAYAAADHRVLKRIRPLAA
ncbi:hypothetical protein [Kitasatospora sp. NPDC056531]|uniref:hypothetical protein n=1 Tax=Kitasatospora sp. NPDC056531 TaxID=3345856 RepID=UPI00369A05AD